MTEDNTDLREAVQDLRERVSELERRVDSPDAQTTESDAYDHYDEAALNALDGDATDAHPRAVMRAYESAGIVDEQTKKKRAKRLKRLEAQDEG